MRPVPRRIAFTFPFPDIAPPSAAPFIGGMALRQQCEVAGPVHVFPAGIELAHAFAPKIWRLQDAPPFPVPVRSVPSIIASRRLA
jgi:hypothetical protein